MSTQYIDYLSFYSIELLPTPHIEFTGKQLPILIHDYTSSNPCTLLITPNTKTLNLLYTSVYNKEPSIQINYPSEIINNSENIQKRFIQWCNQNFGSRYRIVYGINLLIAFYYYLSNPKKEEKNFLLQLAYNPNSIKSINDIIKLVCTNYTTEALDYSTEKQLVEIDIQYNNNIRITELINKLYP